MSPTAPDFAVIGGGLVGLATARALRLRGVSVAVLEAEDRLAAHQSGRSSGVLHAGLYYAPGSLKARLCAAGRQALVAYCAERGIRHERCGKLVVAVDPGEIPRLEELLRRGRANGLAGIERLDERGIRDVEPAAAGLAGLHVPETGITDFPAVAAALAGDLATGGAEVRTGARLLAVRRRGDAFALVTAAGRLACARLINCAGLETDRVAALCGLVPEVRIIPFRGDYYQLLPAARRKVRGLIYPVPDPRFPFLGVHLTRGIDGEVEAGPNAVLALSRSIYRRAGFSVRDTAATLAWPGFWRLAARYWRTGAHEIRRAFSDRLFASALARLVPSLTAADLRRAGCGLRAQAVARDGRLLDDFHILAADGSIHVLNAPSPAATACLAIGEEIAIRALGERGRTPSGPP